MTRRTKTLLRNTIDEYLKMTPEEQEHSLQHIRENIKTHEKGIELIGFGLDLCMVNAARVFLRIYDHGNK